MTNISAQLLDDVQATLLRELKPACDMHDLTGAFAAWLVGEAIPGLNVAGATTVAVEAAGASRTASAVAILGYAARTKELSESERQSLTAGMEWVVGCEPVVRGTPMPFCMDAITLTGLVLGATALDSERLRADFERWIQLCRAATEDGQGLGDWQEWLMASVTQHFRISWRPKVVESVHGSEVRVSLRSKGFGSSESKLSNDEQTTFANIQASHSTGLGVCHAAIRLAALLWLKRQRPTTNLQSVSVQDVANLLRRLPSGLKRWTWEENPRTRTSPSARKWHIENEYHVQNMLWLLLAPLFPDLVDEDSTLKVGPVQPRADIVIPSLRLIVEAKFMRAEDPIKKMVEQIAEDASLYFVAGSKFDQLIPFIWDDSQRTAHHEELIRGLRQIAGVVDAIIIPRPGSMKVSALSEKSKPAKRGRTRGLD